MATPSPRQRQPAGTETPASTAPATKAPTTSEIERRRSTREPVITVGMVRPLSHDDAPAEQVLVTNVSLHGVGFRSTRSLQVSARYHIEIGVGPLHLTSRLRVVRCRVREDGTYDIGGEFC